MKNIADKLRILFRQKRPIKYLIGYFLWRTGLGRYVTFKVKGIKFRFYKSNLLFNLFADREYISTDFDILDKYLSKNGVFIDVGANVGTWSIYASKLVGKSGKVLSFEPNPATYVIFDSNIRLNRAENILHFNVGLSDKPGLLYFTNHLDTMNHITIESTDSIKVPVNTLDSYTDDFSFIDLIKIDVEGFEYFVAKGASQTLLKARTVIFESNSKMQNRYDYKTKDLIDLFYKAGFKIYNINGSDLTLVNDVIYSSLDGENLIAIR